MARTTRRQFLQTTAAAGVGFWVAAGNRVALSRSANERPNVVCIGVGGKGGSDSNNAAQFGNVIAICDVDRNTLENKGKADGFKNAEKFTDYREMLAKHGKNAQIATISTPDHMHAPATLACMRLGISCYTQKPLTRTIYEARLLAQVAKETGVCTQMGNQGTALDSSREAIAQLRSGVLGTLKEVFAWSNRPIWAQGPGRRMTMEKFAAQAKKENPDKAEEIIKKKKEEIERNLERVDWKNWLGVAPPREFWPGLYHSFQWRGWWDFGAGALGDMACHILDPVFWSLKLKYATSVQGTYAANVVEKWQKEGVDESYPLGSMIHLEYPARGDMPPVKIHWYDGGLLPERPDELEPGRKMGDGDGGVLFVGDKGKLMCGCYGKGPQLIPYSKMKDYKRPEKTLPRVETSHEMNWVEACKSGKQASTPFDYAGPFTEMVLMGNLSLFKPGEKILWDGDNMKVTNFPELNKYVNPAYREGWSL